MREMTCMYSIFRDLAIVILSAKFFGLAARKCKAPQVVGEILAGLLIGPCLLNLVQINDTISVFAEIGVVLLMFSTGLGTNLKELMRAGPIQQVPLYQQHRPLSLKSCQDAQAWLYKFRLYYSQHLPHQEQS